MRIQNNITAMNTHRMYTSNNNSISKSAEKLSSGYRINRAGDDAAGLAISEKMRSQIRGLNMASKNSQDANSLIQTAEGALQEVHSMLQRMNELANQSATGTNEDFDRTQISAEFDQLKNEINDISEQTNFNNMKLLDGSLASGASKAKITAGMKKGDTITGTVVANGFTITNQTGLSSQVGKYTISDLGNGKINVNFEDAATKNQTNTEINLAAVTSGDFAVGGAFSVDLSAAGLGTYEMTVDNTASGATAANLASALKAKTVTTADSTTGTLASFTATGTATAAAVDSTVATNAPEGTYKFAGTATALTITGPNNATATYTLPTVAGTATSATLDLTDLTFSDGTKANLGKINITMSGTSSAVADIGTGMNGATLAVPAANAKGGALKIQVGANEGEQLSISVEAMNTKGLKIDASKIDTQEKAGAAITATQDAINMVSEQRSTLGAMQNRLEHKISNLDNTSENLSASESRIRDVDIAKEMTAFTKNQILSQAATAMLAQANSLPQNVLSLMQ